MANQVITGARAKFGFYDPTTGETNFIGTFSTVSYTTSIDVQPAYVLGRYSAAELSNVSYDVVQINASGWRAFEHGIHKDGGMPKLNELLNKDYLQLSVFDRQTDQEIARMKHVRPTSGTLTYAARQMSEKTLSFLAIMVEDEDGPNDEAADATPQL